MEPTSALQSAACWCATRPRVRSCRSRPAHIPRDCPSITEGAQALIGVRTGEEFRSVLASPPDRKMRVHGSCETGQCWPSSWPSSRDRSSFVVKLAHMLDQFLLNQKLWAESQPDRQRLFPALDPLLVHPIIAGLALALRYAALRIGLGGTGPTH